jgi:hypothetical protein
VRRWAALILFEAGIKSLQLKDYDVSSWANLLLFIRSSRTYVPSPNR